MALGALFISAGAIIFLGCEQAAEDMANERQYRFRSRVIATRGVREYRQTIPSVVRPADSVLEIGCEWGTTTALLAQHTRMVIGTDISSVCLDRARKLHPELDFRTLDAFDIGAALEIGERFTTIYLDLSGLSGYRGLLDLIALVNSYAGLLQPRTIVVKSGALKNFAERCVAWS
ncbi:class I SAM-dependent methyltransferase [Actinopolymorpha sp. B11F2]|uniref:class I SAM-dependent methyltransferase n=1 Tax=Actinopolymorpha sp. B11F2 TaxID=3160862 RepID=UPI0032E3D455